MFTKPRLIHRRGLRSAQPAANAVGVGDGTLYYVTDESVLERSNGTTWQSFSAAVVIGGITQLTGDVTAGPGSGTQTATLSSTGVAASTYGSATSVPVFTVDLKGRISAVTNTGITGLLSGLTTPRVPYATSGTALADNAAFSWDNANTRLFVPTIVGGTGVNDDLILQSTSGVGTINSRIFFKVGSNGGIIACEIQPDSGGNFGRLGIGTPGNITVDAPLTVFGTGADIGYVIIARAANGLPSCFAQMQTGANANAQAGFSFTQRTNLIEWQMAVIGSEANTMRWQVIDTGGAPSTLSTLYADVRGNLLLNNSRVFPTTGTKGLFFGDGTVPATMGTDTAGLYANDVGGTVQLFGINEAGVSTQLTGGSLISGLTATRVPFAASATTLTDDAGLTFASSTLTAANLTVTTLSTLNTGLMTGRMTMALGQTSLIAPGALVNLHAGGDFNAGGVGHIMLDGYANPPNLSFRRSDGTTASPTAPGNGSVVCNLRALAYDGSAFQLGGFFRYATNGTWVGGANFGMDFQVYLTANGSTAAPTERYRITAGATIVKAVVAGAFGHLTGAGGSVTQGSGSGKATGVTLDAATGAITMNNATLNGDTTVSFTLTNNYIEANDIILITHKSAGTSGSYLVNAFPGAGSAVVSVRNITTGNLGEAIVLSFSVIKAVIT